MKLPVPLFVVLIACATSSGTGASTSTTSSSASATGTSPFLVRWTVSQGLWGREVFEVKRDRVGHYEFVPAGDRTAKSRDITASVEALDAIARAARASSFCADKSSRLGIPDEGKPTLELHLDGVDCTVSLWDGEWRERQKTVMDLVQALHLP